MLNIKKQIYNLIKGFGYVLLKKQKPSHNYIKSIIGNKEVIVAEIGTWEGSNALEILEIFNVKKIYLIDPYLDYNGFEIEGSISEAQKTAIKKLNKYKNKIIWINKKSNNAINDIPNNLDFIYIDGNHEYKYVKDDLNNYYPKVKSRGFLFGHDVSNIFYSGVVKALFEFCNRIKLTPKIAREDFILRKP